MNNLMNRLKYLKELLAEDQTYEHDSPLDIEAIQKEIDQLEKLTGWGDLRKLLNEIKTK